ncbi:MAG: IS110 family transposase [Anaerolineae bacterium]|nr:IS110 family transposase [Anaerolineae bacterium]
MRKRKIPRKQKVASIDNLPVINPNAAGLDIASDEIMACIPSGRDPHNIQAFGTFTVDLDALADWLTLCKIDTVAMESTGLYWIPIFELLESRGFKVILVNPLHVKQVAGRKSDVSDAQWIQTLHTFGLLEASFRPTADFAILRTYLRHRQSLIESRADQIRLIQAALLQMNLQLSLVLKDITGTTGLAILRDILSGERDPNTLALHRNNNCKYSQEDIAKALTGSWRDEHLFTLRQSVEAFDTFSKLIANADVQIERYLASLMPTAPAIPPTPDSHKSKHNTHSKNAPPKSSEPHLRRVAGVDLLEVDGYSTSTVQVILAEVGSDVSQFPSANHFSSWLGLAPHNEKSGGKILRNRVGKHPNRVAHALRLAAVSLLRSDTALGAYHRRMKARIGPAQAVVATAHKLAVITYYMLRDKTPYRPRDAAAYDQHFRERQVKSLERNAKRLGFSLVPQPQPATI